MPKIEVLSDVLASQVAAGEVVERPASVVKELVENSIDAGAKHIQVEIAKGGAFLIKVTDDGCGMNKEDALLCLERHATSKLKSSEGLMTISTMGFRGEAVPSVASVSKFRLASCEHGEVAGNELLIEGGKLLHVKQAGMSPGTVIEVKQLFFNVPARRKFLKAETTESAHVEHQIKLHALAYPHVRFTYRKDGREVFDVPSTQDRRVRIAGFVGQTTSQQLINVAHCENHGIEVSGFLLSSEYARKGKRQQFIFLNGRPIEDPAISRALKDGFRGSLLEGLHPAAWLWIEMHPSMVDVNVHPAKKEVRFHRPHDVRNLIAQAVEQALNLPSDNEVSLRGKPKVVSRMSGSVESVQKSPQITNITDKDRTADRAAQSERASQIFKATPKHVEQELAPVGIRPPESVHKAALDNQTTDVEVHDEQGTEKSTSHQPDFKTLSLLHQQYILMEGPDGLVVLDPKAARERVVYETVVREGFEVTESQGILIPEILELDAHDYDVVMRNLQHFHDAGIQLDAFGGNSLQLSALPAFLKIDQPRPFITMLIDEMVNTQETKRSKAITQDLFATRLARKTGMLEKVSLARVDTLLRELFLCDLPYCTPSGEPTMIHISLNELAKKFSK